jgi:dipeptidyl-peptidase-4
MRLYAAVLLIAASTCAGQEKKPVTLEAAAAVARGGGVRPVWAPGGDRFASVERGRVFVYEAATGSRKEIVQLSALEEKAVKAPAPAAFAWQNRRVAEAPVAWAASGKDMLASAGGDVFLLHVETGAWEQLTATAEAERDAKLAPDARRVAFRRGHDLYVMEIAGRTVKRLTRDGSATLWNAELDWVYPEELDLGTAWWWSPDGARIAFLQLDVSREPFYPHAHLLNALPQFEPQRFPQPGTPNAEVRLGVTDLEGRIRWMDLGEMRDKLLARIYWSPDSRSLAVMKLNRVQNRLDLLLADAGTGAARVLLHEEDPAWINVHDDFRFLEGGRKFLWSSERDGYRHLYVYMIEGRQEARLTRGAWEATAVAGVDERAREVYYVSTEASPLERQLYAVKLDGRRKRRITEMRGVHTVSMSPTCEYFVDTASNQTTPPRTVLRDRAARQVAVLREPAAEEFELLPSRIVDFKGADGTVFYGRLLRPAKLEPGRKYPVIVMVYGGPHSQTVQDAWRGATLEQYLAQHGYVVWQMDNHGSAGRGHAWEAQVNRNLGERELKDQLEGLRYLDSLGFADLARVGIHGWSYGGYMTLYALTHAPDAFKAGIAGAPVTDWRLYDSIYTERYMGLPEENAEGYRRSSPAAAAASLKAKLLLLHNLEDDNVHFQNTMQMAAALEAAGRKFEMMIYPQRTHGVAGTLRRHMLETMVDFFEKSLR